MSAAADEASNVIRLAAARAPVFDPIEDYDIQALNAEYAVVISGSRTMILHEPRRSKPGNGVRLLSEAAFKTWMANREYTEWKGTTPVRKPIAPRWLRDPARREYLGLEFEPGEPVEIDGAFNLWKGFSVAPDPHGDPSPLLEHIFHNTCRENEEHFDYLVGWFAHMVQRPRERLGTAIALRGGQGSGKTLIGKIFGSLLEAHYLLIDNPRYLLGQFNAHLAQTMFLQADEAFWSGDKAALGHLKGLITSDVQMIEAKGVDPIRVSNHLRLMVTSNEEWVVPAGARERRWFMLDVGEDRAQDSAYFARIAGHFFGADGVCHRGGLLHHLLGFDLSRVDLRAPPRTKPLFENMVRSADPIEAWWVDCLYAGSQLPGVPWLDRVPTFRLHAAFHAAGERAGARHRGFTTQFGMTLKNLQPGVKHCKCVKSVGAEPGANDYTAQSWVNAYGFPTLAECRAHYERRVGVAVEWPSYAE